MGDEFGQAAEWSEGRSLDWWHTEDPLHDGLRRMLGDLNALYRSSPALWNRDDDPACFRWIDADDSARNVLTFVRYDHEGNPLVVAVNFAGTPHENYRLGCSRTGASGTRSSTPTPRSTAAPAWATWAASRRQVPLTRASRRRRRCGCPRWAPSSSGLRASSTR